ncbi:MAG: hypothetical protein RLZZ416_583 [Candidatus Parcubacteria bacterium]|jgi:hypothetical protein
MKKTLIVATALVLIASTASSATEFTFKIVGGAPEGSSFHNYQPYGDPTRTCPGGNVRLEPAKPNAGGKKMTKEAIARGDKRWHVVCVRGPVPQQGDQPPAPQQRRTQRQIRQN